MYLSSSAAEAEANALKETTTSSPVSSNLTEEPDKLYRVVELECRGNDVAVLKSFQKFAVTVGNHFNLESKA